MRAGWAVMLALAMLAGCTPGELGPSPGRATGARDPAQAVLLPTRHLLQDDLDAFARDAVPPALHARLDAAWRAGRTRWPLDELPFDERLPGLLGALAEPGAEGRLQQVFDHQFSGETAALKAAAQGLGLFGARYLQREGDFSRAERLHYAQLVQAMARWGAAAPLGDPALAKTAIPALAAAARATGLHGPADFAKAGMDDSLRRLSAFQRALKQVLGGYGLDLDATLSGLQAEVVDQQGDQARVRLRYTLAGSPVDAVVEARRVDGRWYLADFLRHAQDAVARAQPGMPAATAGAARTGTAAPATQP